jgi:hypothetical protein
VVLWPCRVGMRLPPESHRVNIDAQLPQTLLPSKLTHIEVHSQPLEVANIVNLLFDPNNALASVRD